MKTPRMSHKIATITWTLGGGAILCAIAVLGFFLWKPLIAGSQENVGDAGASGGPRVPVVKVIKDDIQRTIRLPGTIEGFESADLYAKIGGYLKTIGVEDGDEVKKDAELAKLWIPEMAKQVEQKKALVEKADADVKQAEAAVQQAIAKVNSAIAFTDQTEAEKKVALAEFSYRETEHKRFQKLGNSVLREKLDEARFQMEKASAGISSADARIRFATAKKAEADAELEKANADKKSAESRVKVAKANLAYVQEMEKYAVIKAPFDGKISSRLVHPGAYIQPAEANSAAKPLLRITRTDKVRIVVMAPMSDVRWIQQGADAEIESEITPGEKFKRKVTRFSASLDKDTRTLRVEIESDTEKHRLIPESYVYVTLHLKTHKQVPVIPASALMADDESKYVFVVDKDNKLRRQNIQALYEDGKVVGVAKGLSGDGSETIVRVGSGQYKEGDQIVPAQPETNNKTR